MLISHQRVPHKGWKYFQSGTNTNIVAVDWNSLVMAVTNHRRSNGIGVGDVESDIDLQIATNHPELVL